MRDIKFIFKKNQNIISLVFLCFAFVPFVLLAILKNIAQFSIFMEVASFIVVEVLMVLVFMRVSKKYVPEAKQDLVEQDKDVVDGFDFKYDEQYWKSK
ncbi:TPA: hypothetical protein NH480_002833 [Pseudomonas aeruginosa]|uniref:Uncharacterized protein n=1 Tax=Pseudomonas moraviensis R28-S TaxID=1395516 RepID=V8R5I6_9PSED|nr:MULTISPECIES: hypothetical protein [Pseudomonas]ETF06830.1 hypothetical protein PMO01_18445 [Pseudomonas moraviensis R28-S]UYF86576.1 hypothetical protein LLJ53_11225 [Pseudomonas aeruginosa]HCE9854941.1 hypothetical protein [Pseudomonas aeruginosa]